MTDLSKTFSLAEVEGLLAAERERCAKAVDAWTVGDWQRDRSTIAIADAIRNLPPQVIGGE